MGEDRSEACCGNDKPLVPWDSLTLLVYYIDKYKNCFFKKEREIRVRSSQRSPMDNIFSTRQHVDAWSHQIKSQNERGPSVHTWPQNHWGSFVKIQIPGPHPSWF